MKKAMSCRKRPCRICKRWFSPDPRLKDRQMTCGEEACKREWHRRKCAEWNKENSALIKKERLAHRLKSIASGSGQPEVPDKASPGPASFQATPQTQHLLPQAQEVIAAQLAVIFEYLLRQLLKRVQDVMGRQPIVNTG
jgi:hypothetical protein